MIKVPYNIENLDASWNDIIDDLYMFGWDYDKAEAERLKELAKQYLDVFEFGVFKSWFHGDLKRMLKEGKFICTSPKLKELLEVEE